MSERIVDAMARERPERGRDIDDDQHRRVVAQAPLVQPSRIAEQRQSQEHLRRLPWTIGDGSLANDLFRRGLQPAGGA
jgi:hypothetical protein